MSNIESFATGPMWAGFIAFVVAMLARDLLDLGGNKARRNPTCRGSFQGSLGKS